MFKTTRESPILVIWNIVRMLNSLCCLSVCVLSPQFLVNLSQERKNPCQWVKAFKIAFLVFLAIVHKLDVWCVGWKLKIVVRCWSDNFTDKVTADISKICKSDVIEIKLSSERGAWPPSIYNWSISGFPFWRPMGHKHWPAQANTVNSLSWRCLSFAICTFSIGPAMQLICWVLQ